MSNYSVGATNITFNTLFRPNNVGVTVPYDTGFQQGGADLRTLYCAKQNGDYINSSFLTSAPGYSTSTNLGSLFQRLDTPISILGFGASQPGYYNNNWNTSLGASANFTTKNYRVVIYSLGDLNAPPGGLIYYCPVAVTGGICFIKDGDGGYGQNGGNGGDVYINSVHTFPYGNTNVTELFNKFSTEGKFVGGGKGGKGAGTADGSTNGLDCMTWDIDDITLFISGGGGGGNNSRSNGQGGSAGHGMGGLANTSSNSGQAQSAPFGYQKDFFSADAHSPSGNPYAPFSYYTGWFFGGGGGGAGINAGSGDGAAGAVIIWTPLSVR